MHESDCTYSVAQSRQELEQAYSLVYQEYQARKYIPEDACGELQLSVFNLLPKTTTFVMKQGQTVVGTVTAILDSALGLPMDKIYRAEVDSLRHQGKRVAEVSQLAIAGHLFQKGMFSMFNSSKLTMLLKLFKLVYDHCTGIEDIDELCIAVNPKHQYLYNFLKFEELGPFRYYGSVNKAPAVAMRFSLKTALRGLDPDTALYKIFLENGPDLSCLEGKYRITPDDMIHFLDARPDIMNQISDKKIKTLMHILDPNCRSVLVRN